MLWIVGILAALVVLICCIRMGVLVTFAGQSAVVELKIALFHIQCYPAKENGKAAQKQAETAAKAVDKAVKKELPKFEDIREAAKALWPPLRRALGRLGRGIRVDPLDLRVILGGARDPAQTARMYGYLHAGIWRNWWRSGSPISMWVWTMRTRRPYYMVRLASQPDLGPCCGQH